MKSVFEKIIEKLEEMIHPKQLYFCKYARGGCKHLDNDDKDCMECVVENAIEIVKQEAEQYEECYKDCGDCEAYNKEKHHCPKFCKVIAEAVKEIEENHNGWIPCSERLPETNESVLCCAKSTARGGDVCFVGSCHNGFWFLQSSADTYSFPGQYVVVSWHLLPKPFKERD